MARPKSYDRDEAVIKARDAFWEVGYSNLGVRDIEERSGINRFALRTEFGGKEQLFTTCLDSYLDESDEWVLAPMRAGGLDAIQTMMSNLAAPADETNRRFGCLMVNTVIENASAESTAIREKTEHHFGRLEAAARDALRNAARAGELDDGVDTDEAAAFVVGTVIAANVMNRNTKNPTGAHDYVRSAIKTVDTWRR